jgi:hypothetical protein
MPTIELGSTFQGTVRFPSSPAAFEEIPSSIPSSLLSLFHTYHIPPPHHIYPGHHTFTMGFTDFVSETGLHG